MRTVTLILAILAIASLGFAADEGTVGKKGQTLPLVGNPQPPSGPQMRADVEYSTTGAMDTPATTGAESDART